MPSSHLAPISFVLYHPQNDLNIGASLRALTNFNVATLCVVRETPLNLDQIAVTATRSSARINTIRCVPSLDQALAASHHVFALTARPRHRSQLLLSPQHASQLALEASHLGQSVAFLFGQEDHGLSNEALDRATAIVQIPTTTPDYASLNLAQALLVVAWELYKASSAGARPPLPVTFAPDGGLDEALHGGDQGDHGAQGCQIAPRGQVERMLASAEATLQTIEFFKFGNGEHVMRSLRHQFARLKPTSREVAIWFGIFAEVTTYARRFRSSLTEVTPTEAPPIEAPNKGSSTDT